MVEGASARTSVVRWMENSERQAVTLLSRKPLYPTRMCGGARASTASVGPAWVVKANSGVPIGPGLRGHFALGQPGLAHDVGNQSTGCLHQSDLAGVQTRLPITTIEGGTYMSQPCYINGISYLVIKSNSISNTFDLYSSCGFLHISLFLVIVTPNFFLQNNH
jgi:hypothetical protein